MSPKKSPKISYKFSCNFCNYHSNKLSEYNKHLNTIKHKRLVNASDLLVNASSEISTLSARYTCSCGRSYNHDSSYYRHKKKCIPNNNLEQKYNGMDKDELIIMLLKQNADIIKGQQELSMEIVKNGTNNNHRLPIERKAEA